MKQGARCPFCRICWKNTAGSYFALQPCVWQNAAKLFLGAKVVRWPATGPMKYQNQTSWKTNSCFFPWKIPKNGGLEVYIDWKPPQKQKKTLVVLGWNGAVRNLVVVLVFSRAKGLKGLQAFGGERFGADQADFRIAGTLALFISCLQTPGKNPLHIC